MNDDDKLLALSEEIDVDALKKAADEMVSKATCLSHNKRRDLAETWESEHEALCAISLNYLNFCDNDVKIEEGMHQAALNTYAQAIMYNLAADKLKKGLCEPIKIPL